MNRYIFIFGLIITCANSFVIPMDSIIPSAKFNIKKERILQGRGLAPSDYDDTRYELPIDNKTLLILLIEAHSNHSKKNREFNYLLKDFGTEFSIPSNSSGTTYISAQNMHGALLAHIYQVGESILITRDQIRYCTPIAIGDEIAYLRHSLMGRDTEFRTELTDFSRDLPIITTYDFDQARQKVKNILEAQR